jgi:hypothetical protein
MRWAGLDKKEAGEVQEEEEEEEEEKSKGQMRTMPDILAHPDMNFGSLFNDPLPFGVAGASTDMAFPPNNEVYRNYVKQGEFDCVWEEREYYRKKYMEGVQQLVNMEKTICELTLQQNQRKKPHDDYFYQIKQNIVTFLYTKLFPVCKFLPPNWMTYSSATGSLSFQVMKLLNNHLTGFMPMVYWQTILAPYIISTIVQYRCNTNQKLRTMFEEKSNFRMLWWLLQI